MLNLFILILMQQFEQNYINHDNPLNNYQDMSEKFEKAWLKYCHKENILYMQQKNIISFYMYLEKPLGFGYIE